jgi:hypothetical protein
VPEAVEAKPNVKAGKYIPPGKPPAITPEIVDFIASKVA